MNRTRQQRRNQKYQVSDLATPKKRGPPPLTPSHLFQPLNSREGTNVSSLLLPQNIFVKKKCMKDQNTTNSNGGINGNLQAHQYLFPLL